MSQQETKIHAPDFALTDTQGKSVALTDYQHTHHVILVFNRGFF